MGHTLNLNYRWDTLNKTTDGTHTEPKLQMGHTEPKLQMGHTEPKLQMGHTLNLNLTYNIFE